MHHLCLDFAMCRAYRSSAARDLKRYPANFTLRPNLFGLRVASGEGQACACEHQEMRQARYLSHLKETSLVLHEET